MSPTFCSFLLLAEGNEDTLQKANEAIDTIDKLGKAGPITLALVVAIAAVAFAVYTLRKNWKLREDHANELKQRETDAKVEADRRLKAVLTAAEKRREEEKVIYKEMIDRGHEATQALDGNSKALDAFKMAVEHFTKRIGDLDRDQEKRFNELLRAVSSQKGSA